MGATEIEKEEEEDFERTWRKMIATTLRSYSCMYLDALRIP
jgi:hypothetical protein